MKSRLLGWFQPAVVQKHRRPTSRRVLSLGVSVFVAVLAAVAIGATDGSAKSRTAAAELPREQTLFVGRTGGPLVPNGNPLSPSAVTDAGLR